MGQRRQVFSKSNKIKELLYFGDIERVEISAGALSFNAAEKAMEAAAVIEKEFKEKGQELFSIEVFEEPADLFPVSTITIIVRHPATAELGAIGVVTLALVVAALVALGYVVYQTKKVIEEASGSVGGKMLILAAALFGGAALLREGRGFFSGKG
jgi:hypothetical protein